MDFIKFAVNRGKTTLVNSNMSVEIDTLTRYQLSSIKPAITGELDKISINYRCEFLSGLKLLTSKDSLLRGLRTTPNFRTFEIFYREK